MPLSDDGPLLMLSQSGDVLGRASDDDQATHAALLRWIMLADAAVGHRALTFLTDLGERLEDAQGKLTFWQERVFVALFRAAAKLPGDALPSALVLDGLSDDDRRRLGSDRPDLATLFDVMRAPLLMPLKVAPGSH